MLQSKFRLLLLVPSILVLLSEPAEVVYAARAVRKTKSRFFRWYNQGEWRRSRLSVLRRWERERMEGGHQPWRSDVMNTAEVFSANLAGPDKPAVRYILENQKRNGASVLLVTPKRRYRVLLRRPFREDWYITSVKDISLSLATIADLPAYSLPMPVRP